jgi:hypothetical protein
VEEWHAGLASYSAEKRPRKNVLRGVNIRKTTRGKHSICVISSVSRYWPFSYLRWWSRILNFLDFERQWAEFGV